MAQIIRMGDEPFAKNQSTYFITSSGPIWVTNLKSLCYYLSQEILDMAEVILKPLDFLKGESRMTTTKKIIGLPEGIEAECIVVPSQFVEISSTSSFQFNLRKISKVSIF